MTPLLFFVHAPDGTKEYLGTRGEILTRTQAQEAPPWTGTDDQTAQELACRTKQWSIRHDVHIRNPGTEPA